MPKFRPYAWRKAYALALSIVLASLAAGCHSQPSPGKDMVRPRSSVPMAFGVDTHFDQGWPPSSLAQIHALGMSVIRDDYPWGKGEKQAGSYSLGMGEDGYVGQVCAHNVHLLLFVDPRNSAYDAGDTAHSPAAREAYGRFLNALIDHFPKGCIDAIEIGNEINGQSLKYPAGVDPVTAYAALLSDVWRIVKPRHPEVALLGGSTNVIGTGFLGRLFAAGAYQNIDGVVVHPYRDWPEGLDGELRHLDAVMGRYGSLKPVWATEAGSEFDDPDAVPGFLLRLFCQASDAELARLYWYALFDEPYFRNMGLFRPGAQPQIKPAGRAAQTVTRYLVASRAERLEAGRSSTFLYRFGRDTYVFWGATRDIVFDGAPRFYDAQGKPLPPVSHLSPEPIIVVGASGYRLGHDLIAADTLYDYDTKAWSYFARRPSGTATKLSLVDWDWTSYYGQDGLQPLAIGAYAAVLAGDGSNYVAPDIRYTAPVDEAVEVAGCFKTKPSSSAIRVEIMVHGQTLYSGVLTDELHVGRLPAVLKTGETVDLVFLPIGPKGGGTLSYRARLFHVGSGDASVRCV